LYSSPKDGGVRLLEDREYFPAFMKTIHNAKDEIVMSFFLFKTNGYSKSYTDRILAGLVRAAGRGVRIRIILERGNGSRDSLVDKSNRETAARLKGKGIDVRFDSPHITTHTKVAVIDRRYIFLGSHNLTNSALKYNHELSVFIDSPSIAMGTLKYINSLHK
jgi:phosphatidylserine/phosphatidylglycerophosphate/cardiolipin synthase-like enzyme